MKPNFFSLLFLLLISSAAVFAQSPAPAGSGDPEWLSSLPQPDTLKPVQKADSAILKSNQAINRVNAADTVIYNTVSKTDTVFQAADEGLSKLNQAADFPGNAVRRAVDSVEFINKAYGAERSTLDSLNRLINTPADKLSELESKIEDPTIGRMNNVTSEVNEGLTNVGIQHGVDQPGSIGVSDQLRPDGQGGLLPGVPEVPGLDVATDALDKLNEAGAVLDKAQGITEQTKNIGLEVGNISRGDLENTETLSSLGESQLAKTDAFGELNKEAGAFGGLPVSADGELAGADYWKDGAVELVKEEALDYFVGREERLQAAMKQMSKLKGKYSEVKMIDKDQMVKSAVLKGLPWQERLYPSLLFQVVNGQQVVIDFRPGVHYRPYGRWTLNAGGIFRTHFSKGAELTLPKYDISGGFFSTEFKLWRSFSFFGMTQRLDIKRYPPYSDTYLHYHDWDMVFGVKKDFRFSKHVKGTSQVGYNVLYAPNSSPYASRWHLMFGLYYKFKTKAEREREKKFGAYPKD